MPDIVIYFVRDEFKLQYIFWKFLGDFCGKSELKSTGLDNEHFLVFHKCVWGSLSFCLTWEST